MIIRNSPRDTNNYIIVNSEISKILHKHGFIPKYIDNNEIYYEYSDELLLYMQNNKLFN